MSKIKKLTSKLRSIWEGIEPNELQNILDDKIDNFDKNYGDLGSKRSYIIINSNNVIMDGIHRAAILKSIGEEVITCLEIW